MDRDDLYSAVGQAEDSTLLRSEAPRKKRRVSRWMGAVAAVLAVIVLVQGILPGLSLSAYALSEAEYPELRRYPKFLRRQEIHEEEFLDRVAAIRGQEEDFAAPLAPFFSAVTGEFLSGAEGENRLCSPVSLFLTLAMLTEITDGESRQQLMEQLQIEDQEQLRQLAQDVWTGSYYDDGENCYSLSNSLWLSRALSGQPLRYAQEPLDLLARHYYVSTYRGKMGGGAYQRAYQQWMDKNSGGLLSAPLPKMETQDVLVLASTLYYTGKWRDQFSKSKTQSRVFHSPKGDVERPFMHQDEAGLYWWFDHFGAVSQPISGAHGGQMLFLLPDEGVTAEELLSDPQALAFLASPPKDSWYTPEPGENIKQLIIHLAVPRFDLTGHLELQEGLEHLGVTEIFDPQGGDFSPLTEDVPISVSTAGQDIRVAIDEEGVTAAARTYFHGCGASEPPEEEMDFVLDRPFLFVLVSDCGLPLFVGLVNQP